MGRLLFFLRSAGAGGGGGGGGAAIWTEAVVLRSASGAYFWQILQAEFRSF